MSNQLDSLLLNPATGKQLDSFITQPSGVLIISGRFGSGKAKLAKTTAAILMNYDYQKISDHPHFMVIRKPEDKSEISIDAVREVIHKLSLRAAHVSQKDIGRTLIIENAQYLSIEAQNALLKLLEEPPENTLIILTVDSEKNLLPTVISRAQRLAVVPPSLDQAIEFFNQYPSAIVQSAYMLSQGSTELLSALLIEENDHPLKKGVAQAKAFISKDTYGKILQLQQISKDKANLLIFLDALARVLAALQADAVRKSNTILTKSILDSRKAVEAAISQLDHSTNTRLVVLALAVNTAL